MKDPDKLFRSVKNAEVPEMLYDKIVLRISANNTVLVSRKFVRLAAAVLVLFIATEAIVVLAEVRKNKSISSLVELPDNSLNYE